MIRLSLACHSSCLQHRCFLVVLPFTLHSLTCARPKFGPIWYDVVEQYSFPSLTCARPKFGPIWYDVVEQYSFPSLVTDPGNKGVIGKLIHSSSCANFIQVQNAVSPNENPRYKTRAKVVPIFG